MNPAQMAQGGQPAQGPQQAPQSTGTIAPGQSQVGGDVQKVIKALEAGIQQCVDQQGYVDLQKLIQIWPQIAQQAGINIPFQTVMQLVKQDPGMIDDLIVRHGLSGIIVNGQRVSAEQMAGIATGASGGMKG